MRHRLGPKRPGVRVASACGLALAMVGTASAAQRETLIPPLAIVGEVGDGLWAYGHVNRGMLVYDDGDGPVVYPFIDGAASSSRVGLWWRRRSGDLAVLSANAELGLGFYSTSNVDRVDRDGDTWGDFLIRKGEIVAETASWGVVWAGLGSSASDGTSERDLSGTGLALYSSVADSAGGQLFLREGGGPSPFHVSDVFSNFDGLGRMIRLRYDTPSWRGLTLGVSTGYGATLRRDSTDIDNGLSGDVALSWEGETAGLKGVGAVAASRTWADRTRVNGSASVLDPETGVSVTLAAAAQDSGAEPWLLYAKLGWRGDLNALGETAAAVDLYWGEDLAPAGSRSLSLGLGAVQKLPAYWRTEIYGVVRLYDLETVGPALQPGLAVLAGARLSF